MMNGIKEDIKTLLTLELGSPLFHEVVVNLSVRLKALQVQSLWYPITALVVLYLSTVHCLQNLSTSEYTLLLGFLVVEACI
jgi:hypothetical protein